MITLERNLEDTKTTIESMIDNLSIDSFLEIVETICEEKAEHVEANWQDKRLAKRWMLVARRLRAAALVSINL